MSALASCLQDFSNQNGGVRPERVSVLAELEHIQLPLPGLDFADKGMGSIEASGELALCNTGAFSCCLQSSYQCFVTRGAKVLAHRMSPNQGHQSNALASCSHPGDVLHWPRIRSI